jgi:hypothetical protein
VSSARQRYGWTAIAAHIARLYQQTIARTAQQSENAERPQRHA